MTIKTFFGKCRRKILRILLGKNLFSQVTSIRETITESQNIIQNMITESQNIIQNMITESQNIIQNMITESQNAVQNKIQESQDAIQSKSEKNSGNIVNTLSYNTRNYSRSLVRHIHESRNIQEIHTKTFVKYKSIYKEREVVVMGTAPTLNYYTPINDCITMSANSGVLYDKVKLDYLFVEDGRVLEKIGKEILAYDCKKFFSFWANTVWNIPLKYKNTPNMEEYCACLVSWIEGVEYDLDDDLAGHSIPYNICNYPILSFGSVIHPAVQFALWTYPKRIYIVGCDCSRILSNEWKSAHFNDATGKEENETIPVKHVIQGWHKIKEFQQRYYPDVEMISINPVFLKGLFKDEFTDSYLTDKPDADK